MLDPIQSGNTSEHRLNKAMHEFWLNNRGRLIERVMYLENVAGAILAGSTDDSLIDGSRRDAHRLKGSLGTFGLHQGSIIAASIEELFSGSTIGVERHVEMSDLVVQLRQEIESYQPYFLINQNNIEANSPSINSDGSVGIITKDEVFDQDLSVRLSRFVSVSRENVTSAEDISSDLILDLGKLPIDVESALFQLDQLGGIRGRIIVIGSELKTKHRVALAKAGVLRIIDRDGTTDEIANQILEVVAYNGDQVGVVLAVDDDLSMLDALNGLLSQHIKQFHSVSNPSEVWDAIERIEPDLILLDYEMPEINGLDLLRAIRSESKYKDLPVVILSASDDSDMVQRMYAAGADACLTKPLTSQDLTSRVLTRIQRQASQRPIAKTSPPKPSLLRSTLEQDSPIAEAQDGRLLDVVIVDDDEVVAELLAEALNRQGYSVEWLKDGEQAVSLLCGATAQLNPKLVLLDVDMPGINGLDVLRKLASDGVLSQTAVVMLTGRSTESETLEALKVGAVDHVSKPFSLPVLMEKVRRTIGNK